MTTKRIIQDGNNVDDCVKGKIRIDASSSLDFPIRITPIKTPDNGSSCVGLGESFILNEFNLANTYSVGCNDPVSIPDKCQGEYCFLAERASCSFEFCVTVHYCYEKGRKTFCTKSSSDSKPLPASIEDPSIGFQNSIVEVAKQRALDKGEDISKELRILKVFPNPFRDEINLEIASESVSEVVIVIC